MTCNEWNNNIWIKIYIKLPKVKILFSYLNKGQNNYLVAFKKIAKLMYLCDNNNNEIILANTINDCILHYD